MPSYNLGEIMSLATARIGRRADIPVSTVSLHINMAYQEVAESVPHALQERIAVSSTTSGENKIELPADFGEPISYSLVWSWSTASSAISSRKTLAPISSEQADAMGAFPVGTPTYFLPYNNWIELYPSPDSGYSFFARYRSMATDLSATTDVPSISTPYRYAVLLKSEELLHQYIGNVAGAAFARSQYIDYMYRQKSDDAKRQLVQHSPAASMAAYSNRGVRRR